MPRLTRRPSAVSQPPSASTSGEQAAALSFSSQDPLVGRFFHSFAPEFKYPDAPTLIVKWQGHVLGRLDDHTYLIELFSWEDGAPNGQQLQPIPDMADWKFYSTATAMNDWYYNIYSPQVKGYSFEPAQ